MSSGTFWEAFGTDVKQSEVKSLISRNASFEQICEQPTFVDEFLALNEYVIQFLSTDQCIEKLVDYLVDMRDYKTTQYTQKCHYSYFAFTILSTCNTKVYDKLFSSEAQLSKLFSVAQENPEDFVTAQGYLAAMIKNWISNQNSKAGVFVRWLVGKFSLYILPLVHNLSTSNAEIIKEILTCRNEELSKSQNDLFSYIVYYYLSEKFDLDFLARNPDTFDNLFAVFKNLTSLQIVYSYKAEFIPKLFQVFESKNPLFRENLLLFRITVIRYLAFTNQLKELNCSSEFLNIFKSIKNEYHKRIFLNTFLEVLVLLSKNSSFVVVGFQENVLIFLLDVISSTAVSDITFSKVFLILENSLTWILANQKLKEVLFSFLANQINVQQVLKPTSYQPKSQYISFFFFAKLLFKIDSKFVGEKFKSLEDWRVKFQHFYKQLSFEGVNSEKMTEKKKAVKFDISQDIDFFKDESAKNSQNPVNIKNYEEELKKNPISEAFQNPNEKFKKGFSFESAKTLPLQVQNDSFAMFK